MSAQGRRALLGPRAQQRSRPRTSTSLLAMKCPSVLALLATRAPGEAAEETCMPYTPAVHLIALPLASRQVSERASGARHWRLARAAAGRRRTSCTASPLLAAGGAAGEMSCDMADIAGRGLLCTLLALAPALMACELAGSATALWAVRRGGAALQADAPAEQRNGGADAPSRWRDKDGAGAAGLSWLNLHSLGERFVDF
jgi:hypothetical protein